VGEMKRQIGTLHKNSGSTLMIVIISIAIVSILATLLISMSSLSAKLKYWDRQLKQTLYYSEAGLDQIYANISIEIERTLDKAYQNTKEYIEGEGFVITEDNVQALVNEYFKSQFVEELKDNDKFYKGDPFRFICDSDDLVNILNGFINNDPTKYEGLDIPRVISIESVEVTAGANGYENYKYHINGMKVEYTNKITKLRTAIHTDVVIEVPEFDYPLLIQESITTDIPISEFAIIAKENFYVNSNTSINGSVYAGGAGPVASDSDYTIHNNKGILVRNTAKLDITGPNGNIVVTPSWINTDNGTIHITNSKVFSDSIMTTGLGSENIIKIFGDDSETFVYDDLELNANKSNVYLEGNYYGISIGNSRHNSSSSIVVNGAGSTLDLSNARKVLLSGLSYFDLNPNGNAPSVLDAKDVTGEFIRYYRSGESISVRGNHVAYFMPQAYSINDEITQGYDNFFSEVIGTTTVEPEYYSGGSVTMLKINIDERANYFYQYFENMNNNRYKLEMMDFSGIGAPVEEKIKIKLNTASLKIQGAAVATELDHISGNKVVGKTYTDEFVNQDAIIRNNRFEWAVRTGKLLSETDALLGITLPSQDIIDLYLQPEAIQVWNKAYNKATNNHVTFASKDDVTISTTGIIDSSGAREDYKSMGIIISGGNVVINEGVHFEGLIIAGGSIEINGNVNITASRRAISESLATNWRFKNLIFKDVVSSDDSEKVYQGSTQTNITARYGELIKFENWSKNKE
jgi:hypothetical protein